MATTLINPAAGWKAAFLQARTDAAGAAVDDADGEDARLVHDLFTAGIVHPGNAFKVVQDSPVGMTVVVGSGTAETDVAIIQGNEVGQGRYVVRNQDGATEVAINPADATNPRIDAIYIVVQDTAYDATSRVLPRLAYRDGTPSGSPVAPGPDAAWDAYLLLALINVPAADTSIENTQIIDSRVFSQGLSNARTPGTMQINASAVVPTGALLCNGQAVSRTTFSRLFTAIGVTWGVGDGSTTFNVPDMRGRYARGVAVSGTGDALAEAFGADTIVEHVHTMAHTHSTNPGSEDFTTAVVGSEHGSAATKGLLSDADLGAATVNSWDHMHAVDIASFTSGASSDADTGGLVSTPEMLPASKAVHFIIWT